MLRALRRHAVLGTLALVIALVQVPLIAQTRPAASNTPIGQLTIGDATVPIYSFSFGASNTFGEIGGTGRASVSDVSLLKLADALSTPLLRYVVMGDHLPKTRVEVFSRTTGPGATFDLEDVIVTSYQVSGGDVTESVSLAFGRIAMTANGTSFCWDVLRNLRC